MKLQNQDYVAQALRRLSVARTINGDGSVALVDFKQAHDLPVIIRTYIDDDELVGEELHRVVNIALDSAQEHTISSFCAAYSRAKNKVLAQSSDFYVILPVWGRVGYLRGRKRIGRASISFGILESGRLNEKIISARRRRLSESFRLPLPLQTDQSEFLVRVKVRASSPAAAQAKGEQALTEWLGAICFWDNFSRSWRISYGLPDPMNGLAIVPYQTVHDATGALSERTVWYNDWTPRRSLSNNVPEQAEVVLKLAAKTLERAGQTPWIEQSREVLREYYRSFSCNSLLDAFTFGWQVLERVCGDENTSHDVIVKRAAKLHEDCEWALIVGKHLRERRNLYVHRGSPKGDDNEALVFQLVQFIFPAIRFFVLNPMKLSSLQELWALYDLPRPSADRAARTRLLRKASALYKD